MEIGSWITEVCSSFAHLLAQTTIIACMLVLPEQIEEPDEKEDDAEFAELLGPGPSQVIDGGLGAGVDALAFGPLHAAFRGHVHDDANRVHACYTQRSGIRLD